MKIEEPESMQEIHRIRKKLMEEAKDMTPEEQIAYERAKVEEVIKKYGLKIKTP